MSNEKSVQMGSNATHKILHLGLGSFHRAHQALYLQNLIEQGDESWSIIGANVRDDASALISALQSQGGEYTLETITPEGEHSYQTITSIKEVLSWTPQLENIIEAGTDDATKIISFTVTEGGYYFDNNDLDTAHPDIESDLNNGTMLTIYGVIAGILKERKTPVTLLSCDNLRSNGERFHTGLVAFLEAKGDKELLEWIAKNTTSPSCMVDRITPRPTKDVCDRVFEATGRIDKCAVMAEDFIQWVIEDNFIAGRPAWEKVGASLVQDVEPYEEAKIRILNTTHSAISWAGTVKGYTYIHDGVADKEIFELVRAYVLEDVIPCLQPSPLDLEDYMNVALNRFSNKALMDTSQRVAADSFSKIPGFILPTFKTLVSRDESISATAGIIAAFFIFCEQLDQNKVPYIYNDPAYDPVKLREMMTAADPMDALGRDAALWWDLAGDAKLISALKGAYERVSQWLKA